MLQTSSTRVWRQIELKNGTVWSVRGSPQSSVMRFNDRTADRQPHPQPARFGRVERLEQPLNALGSQPRTRIPHRDEHSFRVGFRSADEQIPRTFAHSAHCLHSVEQQIEIHLLQLYSIALNSWQRLR